MIPSSAFSQGHSPQRATHQFGRVVRGLRFAGCLVGSLTLLGCGSTSQWQMRQAQLQTLQQYNQTQQALGQLGQSQQATAEVGGQLAQLQA